MVVGIPQTARSHCVLLVGASQNVRHAVVATLGPLGFEVTVAASYRQALAALSKRRIDIVLSVARLADGSWRDVVSRLADANEAPPVVILAEMLDDGAWAEAVQPGAHDVAPKTSHQRAKPAPISPKQTSQCRDRRHSKESPGSVHRDSGDSHATGRGS